MDVSARHDGFPQNPVAGERAVPKLQGTQMVGRATAGAYGHYIGKSLAIGYVQIGLGALGTKIEVEILGDRYPARVIADSPHDPENARMRG